MAQPQHQMPPARTFSPALPSPSPVTIPPHPYSSLPAAKRPRLSPSPASQPGSPYSTTSPFNTQHSPMAIPSPIPIPTPASAAVQLSSPAHPPSQYRPPYLNGNGSAAAVTTPTAPVTTAAMSMPENPHTISTPTTPQTQAVPPPATLVYTNTMFAPTGPPTITTPTLPTMPQSPAVPIAGAPALGAMGPPPAKAPDKPAKTSDYDFTDTLAGTGIDLNQEERIAADLSGAIRFDPAARTGFPQLDPGNKGSFYGAGPANQSPDESAVDISQKQYEYERATRLWDGNASKLQSDRANELNGPFATINWLHARMEKAAGENGLGLNLATKEKDKDGKEKPAVQPQSRVPSEMANAPTIKVTTKLADDGGMAATYASFVPMEAHLADQLALMSISLKSHLRGVLEESYRISKHRQETTHAAPAEWVHAAAPVPGLDANGTDNAVEKSGENGEAENGPSLKSAIPAKRTASEAKLPNEIVSSLRDIAKQDRALEEKRLLRRQKRQKGASAGPSRAGSVAPGTPGSVAPEPDTKPLTKKEIKKQQKIAEQSTTASVNSTTSHFIFGNRNKDKKKKYSWMTTGASTPSTPRASGGAGTPSPSVPAGPAALTGEGRYRYGAFREDGLVGKAIQMRDLVIMLEKDSNQQEALQLAYDRLDVAKTG